MQSGCNIMDFLQERRPFVRKITKITVKDGGGGVFRVQKKEIDQFECLFPLL